MTIILTALKTADNDPAPPMSAMGFTNHLRRNGNIFSLWQQDRKLDHRSALAENAQNGSGSNFKPIQLADIFSQVKTLGDAGEFIEDALKDEPCQCNDFFICGRRCR